MSYVEPNLIYFIAFFLMLASSACAGNGNAPFHVLGAPQISETSLSNDRVEKKVADLKGARLVVYNERTSLR